MAARVAGVPMPFHSTPAGNSSELALSIAESRRSSERFYQG